ncbi:TIGR00366 family protein [Synergistaceae bacterium OttesenSCG-928-I11]|nr:TIGR00366 family protein [Synergistaceae bacterium OttesenSCG-928-I11]
MSNGTLVGEQKKKFTAPSSMVILFCLIIVVTIMTHVLPAGNFGKIPHPVTGKDMVDAATFNWTEQSPVGPFDMFVCMAKGFIDGSMIAFLIMLGYFWVFSIVEAGAFGAGINALLQSRFKDSKLFIPVAIFIFAIAGSTYGEMETVYGLIPIFVALAIALGYDAIVGASMSYLAVVVGFASATTNPFTIGIAQSFAELPIFSGLALRWCVFAVMTSVVTLFIMRYANMVKADPTKSLVYGMDFSAFNFVQGAEGTEFTGKHKLLISSMVVTIGFIVVGSLRWGWYINEMSAVFFISGIVIQLIDRRTPNQIMRSLVKALGEMGNAIIVMSLARAIMVVMRSGNIIDTVVYGLYQPMKDAPHWLVAQMMLVAQNIINFFIPSGSGQATAIMPIMTPLADLAGVNRQIAVLAFQFGDGYSNALWPTCSCAIMCGIARIPLGTWYRFFLKLFAIVFVIQMIFIGIATAINYGPF